MNELVLPQIVLTAMQIAAILGFSVGFLWGEAFKGFDGMVKHDSLGDLSGWSEFLVLAFLDANHHFQYGLAVMLFAMKYSWFQVHPTMFTIVLWAGWGLVVSDGKDYRNILVRMGVLDGEEEDEEKDPV